MNHIGIISIDILNSRINDRLLERYNNKDSISNNNDNDLKSSPRDKDNDDYVPIVNEDLEDVDLDITDASFLYDIKQLNNLEKHPYLIELHLFCNNSPNKNKNTQNSLLHSILLDSFRLDKKVVIQKSILMKSPKFYKLFGEFWTKLDKIKLNPSNISTSNNLPSPKSNRPILFSEIIHPHVATDTVDDIDKVRDLGNKLFELDKSPFQSIRMRLPRFGSIEAMLCALEFLATGKVYVEKRHFFELLVVAQWLEIEKLINLCATRISNSLSMKSIIPACHFAHRCKMNDLLYDCYRWILIYLVETGVYMDIINAYFSKNPVIPMAMLALTSGNYNVPISAFISCKEKMPNLKSLIQPCGGVEPVESDTNPYLINPPKEEAHHFFGHVNRAPSGPDGYSFEDVFQLLPLNHQLPILYAKLHGLLGEYILSTTPDVSMHKSGFVGLLRSNVAGTEFILYDNGVSGGVDYQMPPNENNELYTLNVFPAVPRKQLAMIVYESNIFGTQPRSFEIVVAKAEFVDTNLDLSSLYYAKDYSKIIVLKNKEPVWNPDIDAYTLDFYSYVKLPSKKNFQLVEASNVNKLYLMFGKVEMDKFHIDFQYPLSIFDGFAIALSALDRKRLVT